jgi:pyruvate formate lyase activating enzyme
MWCHNPESISNKQQLKYNSDQCILCGKCFDLCENKAHELKDSVHIIDRNKCKVCLNCTKECYAEALVSVHRLMTITELEKSILSDEEYYKQSNGGVTFSGGEPMMQVEFLTEILKVCKSHNIHTAVDTAGAVKFEDFEKILPYCDLFLYDIKAYNSDIHKKLTGISNELILENLVKLSKLTDNIWVRIPVIPEINTGEMENIAEFLSKINIKKCEFMPYHKLGEGKYKSLGMTDDNKFDTPGDDLRNEIKNMFRAKNINLE